MESPFFKNVKTRSKFKEKFMSSSETVKTKLTLGDAKTSEEQYNL